MELRILIVDDEQDAGEIISDFLSHYQVSSTIVMNAQDAVQALQTEPFDALIIDLFLPDIDGLQLVQHIRNDPHLHRLPCIAITAYNTSGMRRQAMDAGFDQYYTKPVDYMELAQGLSEILSQRR